MTGRGPIVVTAPQIILKGPQLRQRNLARSATEVVFTYLKKPTLPVNNVDGKY